MCHSKGMAPKKEFFSSKNDRQGKERKTALYSNTLTCILKSYRKTIFFLEYPPACFDPSSYKMEGVNVYLADWFDQSSYGIVEVNVYLTDWFDQSSYGWVEDEGQRVVQEYHLKSTSQKILCKIFQE